MPEDFEVHREGSRRERYDGEPVVQEQGDNVFLWSLGMGLVVAGIAFVVVTTVAGLEKGLVLGVVGFGLGMIAGAIAGSVGYIPRNQNFERGKAGSWAGESPRLEEPGGDLNYDNPDND